MRIIAGTARGTKLETLPGTDITRPTTDRVKEAMFSSVQFILQGALVLDLFAGSGQLGIEALSRGAKHCVFVDENSAAVKIIEKNLYAANITDKAQVKNESAARFATSCTDKFDVVFLDPPYASSLLSDILPTLPTILKSGGTVLAEAKTGTPLLENYGELHLKKIYKYGSTAIYKYEIKR